MELTNCPNQKEAFRMNQILREKKQKPTRQRKLITIIQLHVIDTLKKKREKKHLCNVRDL